MKSVVFILLVSLCSGCIFVPIYDSFRQIGITESDRVRLLTKDVSKFRDALTWNSKAEALAFVGDPLCAQALSEELQAGEDKIKIVEAKITSVNFTDESRKANVALKVKYFEVPYYTVQTRTEDQDWVFGVGEGWKLVSRKNKSPS